jgi:hypothetical protein
MKTIEFLRELNRRNEEEYKKWLFRKKALEKLGKYDKD